MTRCVALFAYSLHTVPEPCSFWILSRKTWFRVVVFSTGTHAIYSRKAGSISLWCCGPIQRSFMIDSKHASIRRRNCKRIWTPRSWKSCFLRLENLMTKRSWSSFAAIAPMTWMPIWIGLKVGSQAGRRTMSNLAVDTVASRHILR